MPKTQRKNRFGKRGVLALGAITLLFLTTRSKSFLKKVVSPFEFRGKDKMGSGAFGAPRNGRTHEGVDIVVTKGQPIYAPFQGKVKRNTQPYSSDNKYKGVVIQGTGDYSEYEAKLFYMLTNTVKGQSLSRGQLIGHAQDISEKYGGAQGGMIPHVHFELRKNGVVIDPTELFKQKNPTT